MAHIKKLFLTLSLLAMQSAFGMDPVTKKARTDAEKWMLINREQDLEPWTNEFAILDEFDGPRPYFIRPFQRVDSYGNKIEDSLGQEGSLYEAIDCRGEDDLASDLLGEHPWKVRGLTRAEVSTVKLGREIEYEEEQAVPNEIRLRALTPSEQTRWVVDDHLKFPVALLAMKKFRHSALDAVPKGVVRYICKLAISDARRENPVVRSIE
jgi:hypothetical protein